MKTVAFFNHKGGVGKTTVLFNVAVVLGELGKRVIIVDADAQANVTALALSEENYRRCVDDNKTVWTSFSPLVSGAGDISEIPPRQIRDNVWILPGDIRLSNFEAKCPVGWTEALAGEERGFRVTSAAYRLLLALQQSVNAEVIIVDLGPNVNALNRSMLIAIDGFVVPLAPDLFSVMALPSVGNSLKMWINQWATAKSNVPANLEIPLPKGVPSPVGYLSQQFSTYRKSPSASFKQWLDRIPSAYEDGIINSLKDTNAPLPQGDHALGSIQNFGALVPTAQESNKALFELSGREAYGAQYTRAQESRNVFARIGQAILDRLP